MVGAVRRKGGEGFAEVNGTLKAEIITTQTVLSGTNGRRILRVTNAVMHARER